MGTTLKLIAYEEHGRLKTLFEHYKETDSGVAAIYAQGLAFVWHIMGNALISETWVAVARAHELIDKYTVIESKE